MESLEEIAKRISESNRVSRERFSSLAVRTARAVFEGDTDELSRITEDATGMDAEDSAEQTAAGVVDGDNRESGT